MVKSDFNFTKVDEDTYLITNYAGRHSFLTAGEFDAFCANKPLPQDKLTELQNAYFCSSDNSEYFIQDYAQAIRSYRDYLFAGTGLHIFVLTSQCNMKCVYCQASTLSHGQKMTKETARKSVDLALQSPNSLLSFEFQGGEPLYNFEVLKYIVEYAEEHAGSKEIVFNLVSNLTLLTDEMVEFLEAHHVNISTSLDGHHALQNTNRPIPGTDGYALWQKKCQLIRERTTRNLGAIQTTTRASLPYYKEIVDEYIANDFHQVFIRPLTPLGYASTHWTSIGYTAEEFIDFYQRALNYIISRAKQGIRISEGHACIFLDKILNHRAGNYTELTSPCGAALGQLAYNYDGKIYTCDEGRMLAQMGDDTFQLGTVDMQYHELFDNPVCKTVAHASCLECIPQCESCVYAPYCGTCPVLNYYENKSVFLSSPNGYKCKIYKGMLDAIFAILHGKDTETRDILHGWVGI